MNINTSTRIPFGFEKIAFELEVRSTRIPAIAAIISVCALFLASAASLSQERVVFFGMCDASAAVAAGADMFIAADDESNILRIYSKDRSGIPVQCVDMNAFLDAGFKKSEADIEGSARIGDRIYWIGSHGRSKKGKERPARHVLFATDIREEGGGIDLAQAGKPFRGLLKILISSPGMKKYHPEKAAQLPPDAPGALNIEGLAATPEGGLLVAFRSPVPGGKALLLPLLNPDRVMMGEEPAVGKPVLLDLGGRGIRSIEYVKPRGGYLLIAASPQGGGFTLFAWSGRERDKAVKLLDFSARGFRPEALLAFPDKEDKVLVLGDDGERRVDGKPCKNPRVPADKKSFRGLWLQLAEKR